MNNIQIQVINEINPSISDRDKVRGKSCGWYNVWKRLYDFFERKSSGLVYDGKADERFLFRVEKKSIFMAHSRPKNKPDYMVKYYHPLNQKVLGDIVRISMDTKPDYKPRVALAELMYEYQFIDNRDGLSFSIGGPPFFPDCYLWYRRDQISNEGGTNISYL